MTSSAREIAGVALKLLRPIPEAAAPLFGAPALGFVAELQRRFGARRLELLERRRRRQAEFDAGALPSFSPETQAVRRGDWRVASAPAELADRRVEITGPVDRKMIINALNSGARVFMADFEDSHSPVWDATALGQRHLHDAVRRVISHESPEGKRYALDARTAVLMVRPRGWHLPEKHAVLDGMELSASLFDFGLHLFHNARELLSRGSGPYFYIPKLESHLEARLWNEVFDWAERRLQLPRGSIKATVLVETLPAAFEMEEILYELRERCVGLNCGRWDYIFSFIKKLGMRREFVLPDRAEVGMEAPFLRAYSRLLIETCHKRGAHAMGGMAAQIPIKGDAAANEAALEKVRRDKEREAGDGHDGTWVAHPALVPLAREVFDRLMPGPNQLGRRWERGVEPAELLRVPAGAVTSRGLRVNLSVGVQYLAAWLCGNGCVPLYHLMEDAATAEISRAQVWQWVRHGVPLEDGRRVDAALARAILDEELSRLRAELGTERFVAGRYGEAAGLFRKMIEAERCPEFLTLAAYDHL